MDELVKALDGIGLATKEREETQKTDVVKNACPKCGRGYSDIEMFCADCGENLSQSCPECGQNNSKLRKFCTSCGTDMEGFEVVKKIWWRMQSAYNEKQWDVIVAAAEELDESVILKGEKGINMKASIAEEKQRAQEMLDSSYIFVEEKK